MSWIPYFIFDLENSGVEGLYIIYIQLNLEINKMDEMMSDGGGSPWYPITPTPHDVVDDIRHSDPKAAKVPDGISAYPLYPLTPSGLLSRDTSPRESMAVDLDNKCGINSDLWGVVNSRHEVAHASPRQLSYTWGEERQMSSPRFGSPLGVRSDSDDDESLLVGKTPQQKYDRLHHGSNDDDGSDYDPWLKAVEMFLSSRHDGGTDLDRLVMTGLPAVETKRTGMDSKFPHGEVFNSTQRQTIFVMNDIQKSNKFFKTCALRRFVLLFRRLCGIEIYDAASDTYSFQDLPSNINYLNHYFNPNGMNIESFWYATLELLFFNRAIHIDTSWRDSSSGRPFTFVVIDGEKCMRHLNLFSAIYVDPHEYSQNNFMSVVNWMMKQWVLYGVKWVVDASERGKPLHAIEYFTQNYILDTKQKFLIPFPDSFQKDVVFSCRFQPEDVGIFQPRSRSLYYMLGDVMNLKDSTLYSLKNKKKAAFMVLPWYDYHCRRIIADQTPRQDGGRPHALLRTSRGRPSPHHSISQGSDTGDGCGAGFYSILSALPATLAPGFTVRAFRVGDPTGALPSENPADSQLRDSLRKRLRSRASLPRETDDQELQRFLDEWT